VEAGEARHVEVPRVELELERVRNEVAGARAILEARSRRGGHNR
jgi:hypothetical protein